MDQSGKITAPMPAMVKPEMVIAEKVASIATNSTSSVWDKLAPAASKAPSAPISGGIASRIGTPPGTSKLQGLTNKLTLDNERYKSNMPNLHGAPKRGIATAMQEVAGGQGAGRNKGNTVFVDDANFPVTLKEIIGSKMLTREQLEMASIENVKKLFNVGRNDTRHQGSKAVGTKEENEELYYMAQRMMLEGFIRGVDITKELKKEGGLNIAIRDVSFNKNAKNNIGLNSTGPGMDSVNFNSRHWRKMNEAEKYTLFLHELGHNLLNRPELGGHLKYDIMGDGPYGVSKKLMSSKEMYNKILNQHFGAATNKSTIKISNLSGPKTSEFDPSWYPQLSGEAVKIDGGNYTPGQGQTQPGNSASDENRREDMEKFNSMFEAFRSTNQAQLDSMSKMMTESFAQQNAAMQQQMHMASLNSMPGPSAMAVGGGGVMGPQIMAAGMTPTMGNIGNFQTTGFATQLANLSDGGGGDDAAGQLISG